MKNHFIKFVLFLSTGLLAYSAYAKEQHQLKEQEKEWTFMVFLNGNNNLDAYGSMNLKQMEEVGSSDKINIVVQWGSMASRSVKRLLIQKSNNPNQVTSPVVQDLGAVDMGDHKSLLEFMKWSAEKYPAKKYFLDVWNHGNGWHRVESGGLNKSAGEISINDISYDDKTGNRITTEQLGQVLGNFAQYTGKKVELYGSDACLMSMAEVVSEMKDSVKFFAGSQDLEPGQGWPYNTFLSRWSATPEADGGEVAKILSDEYLKAYSNGIYGKQAVTFSALSLEHFADFEQSVAKFSSDVVKLSSSEFTRLAEVSRNSQSFAVEDYRDLKDFLSLVKSEGMRSIDTSLFDLEKSYDRILLANDVSPEFAKATGLSIWLPTTKWNFDAYKSRYRGLKFNQSSQWLKVIEKLPKQ